MRRQRRAALFRRLALGALTEKIQKIEQALRHTRRLWRKMEVGNKVNHASPDKRRPLIRPTFLPEKHLSQLILPHSSFPRRRESSKSAQEKNKIPTCVGMTNFEPCAIMTA